MIQLWQVLSLYTGNQVLTVDNFAFWYVILFTKHLHPHLIQL